MAVEAMDDVLKHIKYDMEDILSDLKTHAYVSIIDRDDRRRLATLKVSVAERSLDAESSIHRAYARVAREYCTSAFLGLEIDELPGVLARLTGSR